MMRIEATQGFLRQAHKVFRKNPGIREQFRHAVEQLASDPFHGSLKSHKLKGDLKDFWSCSVTYDIRLRFRLEGDAVVLVDIGSHDEVY